MSEAKESADKKLGIDVVINFEGIAKIVKTLQEKVNVALSGTSYNAQTKAEFDVTEIRTTVADIQKKIVELLGRKISKTDFIQTEISTGGFGSTADVKASLPSSMNLMGATTPQKLLNQYAFENLRKILDKKDDEKKDPFANMELTSGYIRKFVNAWKEEEKEGDKDDKIRRVLEQDKKTKFYEKEILYKELLYAIKSIENKQEKLTIAGVLRILQSRQLGREGKRINPYAYGELGSTGELKKLHKNIIKTAKEAVKGIEAGDMTTEEAVNILKIAQDEISKETNNKVKSTAIKNHMTTKKEAYDLARNTNKSLEDLGIALELTDKKGQKETRKTFVEGMEKNKVVSINTSKEIRDLQSDVSDVKDFADFMALKSGRETVDIMSEKLNEIISGKATQEVLKQKVVMAFQRAAELGSGSAMKSVAKYIKRGLEKETKIKEVAEKFNKDYAPVFESLSNSMSKLKTDDLKVIEKFSEVSESLAKVGDRATASLRVITSLSDAKIDEEGATIIEKVIASYEKNQKTLDTYTKSINRKINSMLMKASEVQSKVYALAVDMDTGYFTTKDYAQEIKNMKVNTEALVPSLERSKNLSTTLIDDIGGRIDGLDKLSKGLENSTLRLSHLTKDLNEEVKDFNEVRDGIIEGVVEGVNRQIINSLINRLNNKFEEGSG